MTKFFSSILMVILCTSSPGAHGVESKSQFENYLAGIPKPAKEFNLFIRQVHESGLKYENVPYAALVEADVPRGRSLQKDAVRSLRGLNFKTGPTYIGYAAGTDKGEIISWNVERGDFDFLQFTKLKKGNLTVKTASRAFCLSCHQGALPIFPRAPWSEMFEDLAFRKYNVHDVDLDRVDKAEREKKRFLNVAFFDKEVRRGRLRKQRETSCRTMCGDDLECRSQLFLAALIYRDDYERRAEMTRLLEVVEKGRSTLSPAVLDDVQARVVERLSKVLTTKWPEDGFALTSTTIPDRSAVDPKSSGFLVKGKLRNGEDAATSDGFSHVSVSRSPLMSVSPYDEIAAYQMTDFSDEKLSEVQIPTSENGLADPKALRPLVGKIPKEEAGRWAFATAMDCFDDDAEIQKLLRERRDQLEKALRSTKVLAAFCRLPFSTAKVASSIRDVLATGKFEQGDVSCAEQEVLTTGLAGLDAEALAKLPAKGAFRKYCNECHADGSEIPLKLDDVVFLRTFPGAYQHGVRSSLELKIMPPKTARQPSDEERRAMLKAIDPAYRDRKRGSS